MTALAMTGTCEALVAVSHLRILTPESVPQGLGAGPQKGGVRGFLLPVNAKDKVDQHIWHIDMHVDFARMQHIMHILF